LSLFLGGGVFRERMVPVDKPAKNWVAIPTVTFGFAVSN
jgi:hypothetical protein